jgi:hypothetical protein
MQSKVVRMARQPSGAHVHKPGDYDNRCRNQSRQSGSPDLTRFNTYKQNERKIFSKATARVLGKLCPDLDRGHKEFRQQFKSEDLFSRKNKVRVSSRGGSK